MENLCKVCSHKLSISAKFAGSSLVTNAWLYIGLGLPFIQSDDQSEGEMNFTGTTENWF